jgi:hypothetical protein
LRGFRACDAALLVIVSNSCGCVGNFRAILFSARSVQADTIVPVIVGMITTGTINATTVLTRYLAKELGPRRITANVVAPGAIQTDFGGGMVRDNPEINKRVAEMTALGRAGVPDDIGPMIAALLSDENRWVNAQRIEVSGGMAI